MNKYRCLIIEVTCVYYCVWELPNSWPCLWRTRVSLLGQLQPQTFGFVSPFQWFLITRTLKFLSDTLLTSRRVQVTLNLRRVSLAQQDGSHQQDLHTRRRLHCWHPARDLTRLAPDMLWSFTSPHRTSINNMTFAMNTSNRSWTLRILSREFEAGTVASGSIALLYLLGLSL